MTLTYDDDHIPEDGSLNTKDYQLFMKRLRRKYGSGIRFFQCGEYGEKLKRPHHHALLFNFDFPDKKPWVLRNDIQVWRSPTLESLWDKGLSEIGSVTFESAAYVARYITKKVSGTDAVDHYVNQDNGVVLKPEYVTMSRRPGIAAAWFKKWSKDVYPHDYVYMNGAKMRPPKFYDKLYDKVAPMTLCAIKERRSAAADMVVPVWDKVLQKEVMLSDNRDERLEVKERIKESRLKLLPRPMEE